ncbi:MAG: PDDEXK nuclease domain-containing protein [Methanoregula sp.]|nr:PDDEXK nuclease domain-containing protein [Methanoregula sp.]
MSKTGEQFPTKSKPTQVKTPEDNDLPSTFPVLLGDIQDLIETARTRVAIGVNVTLLLRNWSIGSRIRRDILGKERAPYGKKIVATLSQQLAREYGQGFERTELFRMIQFATAYPDEQIVQTLSQQLSWSHFVELIKVDDPLAREYYAALCRIERWNVRTLRDKINGMLFERTAISKKPEELIREELAKLTEADRITPDLVFRDPYFLNFLKLEDTFSERDLESAILRDLERFILELGTDFSFVARQKRITVDTTDYYIDLLFYHRRLHRLVAIDLKLERFQAAYKGQMELYLRWLDKYDRPPGEETPIGLILCAGKSAEHVELLELEQSGIRVAEYLTELPPRDLLERKLKAAVEAARERFAGKEEREL